MAPFGRQHLVHLECHSIAQFMLKTSSPLPECIGMRTKEWTQKQPFLLKHLITNVLFLYPQAWIWCLRCQCLLEGGMFGHVSNEQEVKILPGHFGHTILLNQKAEKGTGHWLELLIPVTRGKNGLLLHNEEKENYFWNSGDLLSCYYTLLPNYTGQMETGKIQ